MADAVKKRRWMPIVLGLSLAMNFAVVAAVGGAAWRHSGDERSGAPRAGKSGALYMSALPRESRRAIREQMRSGPRPERSADQMLVALRSEPLIRKRRHVCLRPNATRGCSARLQPLRRGWVKFRR